jgi:hypothetical protein
MMTCGGGMLGSDLLNLRRNKTSSVATLVGRMDQLSLTESPTKLMMRTFELNVLADAVLTNVAVHAQEAYWGDVPLPTPRRGATSSNRRRRRPNSANLHQRQLFA